MAFNELQRQVAEYDAKKGWVGDTPEQAALHMQEELGEIARELLKMSGYKKGGLDRDRINDEITDLLYLTMKLGNLLKLDLDEGWGRIGGRYERK
jgi:NTP pyrophosphatase (non-canonical NTP hydrolase)